MHFNRLSLPRDNQDFAAISSQIICAFIYPFLINPRRSGKRNVGNPQQRSQSATLPDQARRNTQSMISIRARKREQRLDRVKSAHSFTCLATGGKFADIMVRVIITANKIAIQRQNDLGFVEMKTASPSEPIAFVVCGWWMPVSIGIVDNTISI